MSNKAYIRVSTNTQDLEHQKFTILEYLNREGLRITEKDWIEITISTRKTERERKIHELIDSLHAGDRLFISELSRLGRSLKQIIDLLDILIKKDIRITVIKQRLDITKDQDIQTKILIALLAIFAEIERDLISQRTKQALASKKARGIKLGRPKGSTGKSKLDGKEDDIRLLLTQKASKAFIARVYGVSRTTVVHFIRTRNLQANN